MGKSTIKTSIPQIDYSSYISISELPYTITKPGLLVYQVGDGNQGGRNLIINGVDVGSVYNLNNAKGNLTFPVTKGDVINSTYSVWGSLGIYPYK